MFSFHLCGCKDSEKLAPSEEDDGEEETDSQKVEPVDKAPGVVGGALGGSRTEGAFTRKGDVRLSGLGSLSAFYLYEAETGEVKGKMLGVTGNIISYPVLPSQVPTNWVAQNSRHVFSPGSGGQESSRHQIQV